jgi:hypothetical protein
MQTPQTIWISEPAVEFDIRQSSNTTALVQHQTNRKLRVALPLPRRESCLTKRAMLAALREAELAAWQGNGGDYLHRSPQPIC